ncbi:MAG TPA: hypothetical protein VIK89_00095, partial [Cytophagaceae bacterium]
DFIQLSSLSIILFIWLTFPIYFPSFIIQIKKRNAKKPIYRRRSQHTTRTESGIGFLFYKKSILKKPGHFLRAFLVYS